MKIQPTALCLVAFFYSWSSQSLALSCPPLKPIEQRMADVSVIAIVKTEADVKTRVLRTTTVLKGEANATYYFEAPLVNPILGARSEIKPNTDYLLFAGDGNPIGYSMCGSNGLRAPIVHYNGWPPSAFLYIYPYLEKSNQLKVLELLSTYWPEVRAKWIDFHGRTFRKLGDDWTHIRPQWNPVIVEDNLDSPYLSEKEKNEIIVKNLQNQYAEKYKVSDEAELLKLRHENGELGEFEYDFYRDKCVRLNNRLDYCSIFD